MVGSDRRAVRRALRALADRVEIIPSSKNRYGKMDSFDVILKAPTQQAKLSQEKPAEQPTVQAAAERPTEELGPGNGQLDLELKRTIDDVIPGWKEMGEDAKMHAIMKLRGYSVSDRRRIIDLIGRKGFDFPVVSLAEYVRDCEKYHKKSGRQGTAAKLLIYKLEVSLGIRERTTAKPSPKPAANWAEREQRQAILDIEDNLADIRIELERMGATNALSEKVIKKLSTDWTRADYWRALREVGSDVNNLWAMVV